MIPRRHLLAVLMVGSLAATLAGCSKSTESPTSPMDMSPPQSPSNLRSQRDNATNRDWIAWNQSASASVLSYEILVSDNPGANGDVVATVDATSDDFVLPIVAENTTEYYRVRAVGTNRIPSAMTPAIQVDRTGFEGTSPTTSTPGKGSEGSN